MNIKLRSPLVHKFAFIVSLLIVSMFSEAQICTGSLGDPVVNIGFGSGIAPGGPLAGSTTNYTYTSVSCPPDGSYTVVNSSSNCFGSTWHNVPEDHTVGDNNGYMMLINASFNPGDFYVDTAKGLCENTTYEFSSWILNILKNSACQGNGIEPNLTFAIETTSGLKLGKYETGPLPQSSAPEWKQYGLFFKTPAGVTNVVIRLTNNAPGGCGNDLVLDDITFRPCGPTVTAATVIASGNVTTLNLCDTDQNSYQLTSLVSTGYQAPSFQWQISTNNGGWVNIPGATTLSYERKSTAAGQYRYRVAVAESGNIGISSCRVVSNQVLFIVNGKPSINAGSNSPVCEGGMVRLTSEPSAKIQWTGPNGYLSTQNSQFTATQQVSGKYYITSTSQAGCTNTDSTIVTVHPTPTAVVGNDETICEGNSAQLQASGGTTYLWYPDKNLSSSATATPVARPVETTTYTVIVSNDFNCKDSSEVTINVLKKPVANAGPDKKINEGQTVLLQGSVTGTEVSFFWTPSPTLSNGNTLTPSVQPDADMMYTLNAVSNLGCGTATDNVFVRVFKKVEVPNAFSPNGDGVNDTWNIEALETYPEAVVTVFNRHGQQVFFSRGYSRPWDGKYKQSPLPLGTYYYIIDLQNNFPIIKGWIYLVR